MDIREPIHEEFYETIVGHLDCGPFDGGCVTFAHALRSMIGGEVCVIVRSCGCADHAVVHLDGRLWDWDGPDEPKAVIERFNRTERASGMGWRAFAQGDLPNAPVDDEVTGRLAFLLAKIMVRDQKKTSSDRTTKSGDRIGSDDA